MSHYSQRQFFRRVRRRFPQFFDGVSVVDLGSLYINGDCRQFFTNYTYVGVDVGPGYNVDVVSLAHEYKPEKQFDVVVSAEMLEHDPYYKQSLLNMVELVRPGGLVAFSCASMNRPEHGTANASPWVNPLGSKEFNNYYKNLREEDIREVLDCDKIFSEYEISYSPYKWDLYFWGIKKDKSKSTIVYYSHNQEEEYFERVICENILSLKGDIPIISVSHKPMPWFGTNICVGDVGICGHNAFRQLLIGSQLATTPFIICAESDDLYPPEYFQFIPPDENKFYRYTNLYLLFMKKGWFRFQPKYHHEGGQICGREYLIDTLSNTLGNQMWRQDAFIENPAYYTNRINKPELEYFTGENPIISVKTVNGMHSKTNVAQGRKSQRVLPYWGTTEDVKIKLGLVGKEYDR